MQYGATKWYFFLFIILLSILSLWQNNLNFYTGEISSIPEAIAGLRNDLKVFNQRYLEDVSLSQLPKWDYIHLINLDGFRFNLIDNVCFNSSSFLLFIFILSAPNNIERRHVIRETWGNLIYRDKVKIIFAMAETQNNHEKIKIEQESKKFQDIIQGNFMDTYRNLTYKHVMSLKFATYYCPQARFVMKADDDVFIKTPALIKYLENKIIACGSENLIICRVQKNAPAMRNNSKWIVSVDEYPNSYYPDYCLGNLIIYSSDVARKLYFEAQKGEFFWIEDVYMTGILAKRLNLPYVSFANYTLTYDNMKDLINNNTNAQSNFMFGPIEMTMQDIKQLSIAIKDKEDNNTYIDSTCR